MIRTLLKNDFRKNMGKNLILLLFMTLSAAIAVSVCLMLTQLFSSLTDLYETAKPPHFLQMHKGELEQADIDAFNGGWPEIEHWQTVPMIDVHGEELSVESSEDRAFDLSSCRLDISLVRQNRFYDVLLDGRRQPVAVQPGEIGVPVILLEQFDIRIGDTVILQSGDTRKRFTVASYVYDAQMNSTLCSSTRFLLNDADFEELSGRTGETEYLIEAWFTDASFASEYQTAYEQNEPELPKDGQAVTYTVIFLLSAMTDMMTAAVFLLAGGVLLFLAILCLRYCLLAELEEDAREIGTMKAIGVSPKGIRELYLGKIRILTAAGCVAGFLTALLFSGFLTSRMNRTFGQQSPGPLCYIAALAADALVFLLVMLSARKLLNVLNGANAVDLLVTETGFGKKRLAKDGMSRAGRLPVDFWIGFHEAGRGYGMIFVLTLCLAFLMATPFRMAETMADEEFVTYMGSPVCDVLLEVEQGGGLAERKADAERFLERETERGAVRSYESRKRIRLQARNAQGELTGIHADTGYGAGSGLRYLSGCAPQTEYEIALSALIAEELELEAGGVLTLMINGKPETYIVSGVYQDVTSGGRTAKIAAEFPETAAEQYTYQIYLDSRKDRPFLMENWREQLGNGYSIEDMEQFAGQTLGQVTKQIKRTSCFVIAMGMFLEGVMVMLFLKLRLAKMRGALAIKRAIGIPYRSILRQEKYPVMLTGGLGICMGLLLTETIGDVLVSILLSMLGIGLKRLEFCEPSAGWTAWLAAGLLLVPALVTAAACRTIRKMDIVREINE